MAGGDSSFEFGNLMVEMDQMSGVVHGLVEEDRILTEQDHSVSSSGPNRH